MDVGFPEIVSQILWLFILVALVVGVFGFCSWAFLEVVSWFGKWLLKKEFMQRLISCIQQKSQQWWIKNREQTISLWEFVSEVLIDPLFYGYALYVLVSRFESITNSTKDYPQYDFWRLLDLDMREDMNFYIVFMIIFILWIFGKSWKHRQELRRDKSVARSLEKIAGVLENMDKKLDDLPVNVRLELEKKDEKPKSKNSKPNL